MIKHSYIHYVYARVASETHFNLLGTKRQHSFPMVLKHGNDWLFDCLQHTVPQSRKCSSYITSSATLKMLRKLNCIATRISKVTESRWVGRSPNSRCFIPSGSKNSSGEDREPETMLRLARFHQFWDEPGPTQPLCHVREVVSCVQRGETAWAVTLRH